MEGGPALRFLIALLLILGAAVLIGAAGGIEVLSVADWKSIGQKWAMPSVTENERCIMLLTGAIVALLAVARVLSPMERKRAAA